MHNMAVHFCVCERSWGKCRVDMLELAAFGDVLKSFRKRKKISQQALAAKLGVHRNTIGLWERGDCLPDSRGMVVEVARLLALDEAETRHLLEASLTAVATHWLVPYQRNPFLTGHEALLQHLHALLHDETSPHARTFALQGLGGIGKTQIAIEYAYRHYQDYSALFWIGADTYDTLLTSYTTIADLLQLPYDAKQEASQAIAHVMRWLNTHSGWLLIFDHVEDIALLKRFLPSAPHGAMLITTRLQSLGSIAHGIEVPPLSHEESIALLLRRGKQHENWLQFDHAEYRTASTIVAMLDGLPLAIDQAGAYIEETGCSLTAFLALLESQPVTLLQERAQFAEHPQSVVKTFALIFEQIHHAHPLAADLLTLCTMLAPGTIPEQLLQQLAFAKEGTEAQQPDLLRFNAALKILLSYSLIQRHTPEETLSVHRLVHTLFKESLSVQTKQALTLRVATLLEQEFPLDFTLGDYWQRCITLLPHVLYCLEQAGQQDNSALPIAGLATRSAWYLFLRARYEEAENLWQQAIAIYTQAGVPRPEDIVYALSGLATLCTAQGRYAQAEQLFQQARTYMDQLQSTAHPCLVYSQHGQALLYRESGRYNEAESCFQQTIALRQHIFGEDHPWVGIALNDLAILYARYGDYVRAEECFLQAIAIWEQVENTHHPYLAYCLSGLTNLYSKQGRFQEAEPFIKRLRAVQERNRYLFRPYMTYQ